MSFKNAWIGWKNYFNDGVVTASSTAQGYSVTSLKNWYSWQRWRGGAALNGGWEIIVDAGSIKPASYMAIGGHTGLSARVELWGSNDGSTWTSVATLSASGPGPVLLYDGTYTFNGSQVVAGAAVTDKNISLKFDEVSHRYWKFNFLGSAIPEIGVLAIGPALEFERGFYGGFIRPTWNEEIETLNSTSERGVFLGRSIIRSGNRPFGITLEPVSHNWVDTVWQPFRAHADLYPFIFAWEPDPNDANGLLNTEDTLIAWTRSWSGSTLKDKRWASVGGQFEGVIR